MTSPIRPGGSSGETDVEVMTFEDQFESHLEDSLRDPGVRAAFEDAESMHWLLDRLVGLRKALGLTQREIARRMGIRQPTVSEFEKDSSDPRLSTIQRYARAVECRVTLGVDLPADCDWLPHSANTRAYLSSAVQSPASVKRGGSLARDWEAGDLRKRGWGLVA
jgi:transcriptional regulator with XRE-family HTH domain